MISKLIPQQFGLGELCGKHLRQSLHTELYSTREIQFLGLTFINLTLLSAFGLEAKIKSIAKRNFQKIFTYKPKENSPMKNILQEIKPLFDLGFSIIRLHPKQKRPIENNWTKLPNLNFKKFSAVYRPGENVGLRCGSHSRLENGNYLVVIDCDLKSKEKAHFDEFNIALSKLDLADAPKVISGRGDGSCHYYVQVKTPPKSFNFANSKMKVKVLMPSEKPSRHELSTLTVEEIKIGYRLRTAWEITVCSTGKQVVIPPSVHPDTKKAYRWEKGQPSLENLPVLDFAQNSAIQEVIGKQISVELKEINLADLKLSDRVKVMIQKMQGGESLADPSRSGLLFSILNQLVFARLDDSQIVSILLDPENEISNYVLEKNKGNKRKASFWLMNQIQKIRKEGAINAFEIIDENFKTPTLGDAEAELQLESLDFNVEDQWQLEKASNGQIKKSIANLIQIFKKLSAKPLFKFDEFSYRILYNVDPPWRDGKHFKAGDELADADITAIRNHIDQLGLFEPPAKLVEDVVKLVSLKNSVHPVRDYLEGLVWDQTPRLSNWLLTYLHAKAPPRFQADQGLVTEYLRAVGRKTLVGAVTRIMEPGCAYDQVLVIEGVQGVGKSTALNILGGEWFSDTLGDISNKDVINNLQRVWILELPEMSMLSRSERNQLKEFISRKIDRARLAFERTAKDYPRQCIFIGTTNDEKYLKDPTGNRRFWPVYSRLEDLDRVSLKRDRDQLWAEAMEVYREGSEKLFIAKKEPIHEILAALQNEKFESDVLEEQLLDIFQSAEPNEFFTLVQLFEKLNPGAGSKSFTHSEQKRFVTALKRINYESIQKKVGGKKLRIWVKKGTEGIA